MNKQHLKFIAAFTTVLFVLIMFVAPAVQAAEPRSFTPTTDIPLLPSWQPGEAINADIGTSSVINELFSLSIRIGAMLSVFMFIWGGLNMIMARNNASSISEGKKKMKNAVFGLLMLLSTFVVLNTINPELVNVSFLSTTTARLSETQDSKDYYTQVPILENEFIVNQLPELGVYTFVCSSSGRPTLGHNCFKTIGECVLKYGDSCVFVDKRNVQTKSWCTTKIGVRGIAAITEDLCYPTLTECNQNKYVDSTCDYRYPESILITSPL